MVQIHITEITTALSTSDFFWILIPIFFIGVVTDKYQEEFGTSIGNAISNGALIIFTGFSWLQVISSRDVAYIDVLISQYLFSIMIIIYGFAIIASGFGSGDFAQKYGRIRVVTFMLMFFTMMIYVPLMYNFVSIVIFVLIFPLYYAFISWLIHILPESKAEDRLIKKRTIKRNKFSLK